MSPDPEADLERLRGICLALPHSAERLSHGMPAFHIEKGKIFAWFWHDHHRDGRTAIMVKTSGIEEQEMLIELDPELYYRPAYLGPFGWVAIRTDQPDTDWDHIADRVATSWELIAPPKLRERR
jgi:hypothetical protein